MRYGIISDIHSNLEALTEVLTILKKNSIDQYLCLGDIIDYGADPSPCVELVKSLDPIIVIGNHEWAFFHPEIIDSFNEYAKKSIVWTAEQISVSQKNYLNSLPLTQEKENFILVHSSLEKPEKFNYVFSLRDLQMNFQLLKKKICFFGHSHIPGIYVYNPEERKVEILPETEVKFKNGKRYLVNVGSVGQPRDRNPAASFGIYDTEKKILWIKRCFYEVKKAQEKIVHAGLPEFLAERHALGK